VKKRLISKASLRGYCFKLTNFKSKAMKPLTSCTLLFLIIGLLIFIRPVISLGNASIRHALKGYHQKARCILYSVRKRKEERPVQICHRNCWLLSNQTKQVENKNRERSEKTLQTWYSRLLLFHSICFNPEISEDDLPLIHSYRYHISLSVFRI
jgi:hypothetical protein